MIHDVFDIERFKALFPLPRLREEARQFVQEQHKRRPANYPNAEAIERHIRLMEPGGEVIMSPRDIAVVEQLRAETLCEHDIERLPTDVFVFARGDPRDPRATKVGGVPFWPRADDWPEDSEGAACRFVGQVCFMDSRFAFPDAAADILCVFCEGEPDIGTTLHCRWVSGKERQTISVEDVPAGASPLRPCHGVLHRTYDYIDAAGLLDVYRSAWYLGVIEGTKIGGKPRWIQYDEELPGQFACAIGSVLVSAAEPSQNVPGAPAQAGGGGELSWGDAGSAYFFIDSDETIHYAVQCY